MTWTSISWTDANGTVTELQDPANGVGILTAGSFGLNAPPVELNTASLVSLDGSLLVKRRRGARDVMLPMWVESSLDLQAKVRTLTSALQGPGTLTVSDGTVTRSLLDVYYDSGLGGEYGPDIYLENQWQRFPLSLLALDPWWYGELQTVTLAFGSDTTFDSGSVTFDSGPFDGGATTPATIAGDATALPSFAFTGPFDTCQVGVAGGSSMVLAAALAAGNVITVDTVRGNRGPRLNGGSIDWSLLTPESRLFELPVGLVSMFTSSSGTTGSSALEMTYRERWLTA